MGVRIKTNRRRGGFVENVWFDKCTLGSMHWMFGLQMDILYQWADFPDYEIRYTRIRNINVSDVTCKWAEIGLGLYGDCHMEPSGLTFSNVRFGSIVSKLKDIRNCRAVRLDNVTCAAMVSAGTSPEYGELPFSGSTATLSEGHRKAAAFINRADLAQFKDGDYDLGEGTVARIGVDMMRPVAEATYSKEERYDTLVTWVDPGSRERFWVGPDRLELSCGTGEYAFVPAGLTFADRLVYANSKPCRRVVVKIRNLWAGKK